MTHSCEKPLGVLQDLIYELSEENDIVLDCFMGTGSTGEASIRLNRKFIGIEIDDNNFDIAKNRIENTYNELMKSN